MSLKIDRSTFLLGEDKSLPVLIDTLEKVSTALARLYMLYSDVNTLGKYTVTDTLVDNDTDRGLGDIKNSASSTMVVLEWHTLLDRWICFDIDDVAYFVVGQVGSEGRNTFLSKVFLEEVTCAGSVTE